MKVADTDCNAKPGSIVFVGSGTAHNFHDITENLMVKVIFSPPTAHRLSQARPPTVLFPILLSRG